MRGERGITAETLLFGPGERLAELMGLVVAMAPSARARQIVDLDELAERRADEGLLLVDADVLPAEDVGYLRRFLTHQSQFALTLVGEDSSRRVARSLLRLPRVAWMAWPPDLEDVRNLVAPARAGAVARASPAPAPPHAPTVPAPHPPHFAPRGGPPPTARVRAPERPAERPAERAGERSGDSEELARIEEILDLPGEAEALAVHDSDAVPVPGVLESGALESGARPPAYFRDQVADLADIAQRIEGDVATAFESASLEPDEAEHLTGDVARLVQFTRTLSYLTSPPPQGDQEFDLSEFVETLVSGLPRQPQSPRWLVRTSGAMRVRSDRELLLQAFDALLFVAEACSGRGEIVRVLAGPVAKSSPRRARVSIEFGAGPLVDMDAKKVLEPYALRPTIPDLGPNALSAAVGIVAGQSGRLELRKAARGRLAWILELPLLSLAGASAGVEVGSGSAKERASESPSPESGGTGSARGPHEGRGAADPFA